MSLDPQAIAAATLLIGATGKAVADIITALRRYHGPPDDPPRSVRRVRRNVGEDGDG